MAVNKVIYGNRTLIDLSSDTVKASDLKDGSTAHDKSGATIVGTLNPNLTVTNFTGRVTLISGQDYLLTVTG